jgi:hypothetical protein
MVCLAGVRSKMTKVILITTPDVMPLIYAAIETQVPMVQEKALRIIPVLAESLDYTTVKNSLFPRVQVCRL